MHRARNGEFADLDAALHDAIDAWHSSDTVEPLAERLGFTADEYARWAKDPSRLAAIVAKKYAIPLRASDSPDVVAWLCATCRAVYPEHHQDLATRCCDRTCHWDGCSASRATCYVYCDEHRKAHAAQLERERFEKAEKIDAAGYVGFVFKECLDAFI